MRRVERTIVAVFLISLPGAILHYLINVHSTRHFAFRQAIRSFYAKAQRNRQHSISPTRNSQRHLTDRLLIPVTQLGDTGDLKRKNKSLLSIRKNISIYFPLFGRARVCMCVWILRAHISVLCVYTHVQEEGHSRKGTWEKKREPTEARRDRLLRHSCNFPVVSRLVNSR